MTNSEILKMQREHRTHLAAVPVALTDAKAALTDFDGRQMDGAEPPMDGLTAGTLRTLVKEVERLQAAMKQARRDAADEHREARHAASAAYYDGRNEAIEESRGY